MRFVVVAATLLGVGLVSAASWSFEDAKVEVKSFVERLSPQKPLSKPVDLGPSQTLKILLTATNGKKARRPQQVFLTLTDPTTGLEESYPFTVKENGKAKVDISHNTIPSSLVAASTPIVAQIVIADFGSSIPYKAKAFDLNISFNADVPRPRAESPLRYGALPEIHHIFRPDPRSPPKLITLFFLAAAVATVPALFIAWGSLGANLDHLGQAMNAAPTSHALFFCSIVAMEGVFLMYYTTWNLFQMLPVAGAVATIAFVSGTKALTEVQERRLAGLR